MIVVRELGLPMVAIQSICNSYQMYARWTRRARVKRLKMSPVLIAPSVALQCSLPPACKRGVLLAVNARDVQAACTNGATLSGGISQAQTGRRVGGSFAARLFTRAGGRQRRQNPRAWQSASLGRVLRH